LADGSEVRLGTGEVLLSPQRRYRSFWIESDVVNAVADYLTKDRAEDDEPALLVTKQGKRINTSATSTVVAKWCKSAGIEPLGCHRFRQNLGVNLAVTGTSGLVMMQLLGYAIRTGVLNGANPIRDVALPKANPPSETYAYTLLEIAQIMEALPDPARTIVATAAFTGLRRGELRASMLKITCLKLLW
jgi:integrase